MLYKKIFQKCNIWDDIEREYYKLCIIKSNIDGFLYIYLGVINLTSNEIIQICNQPKHSMRANFILKKIEVISPKSVQENKLDKFSQLVLEGKKTNHYEHKKSTIVVKLKKVILVSVFILYHSNSLF